MTFNERDKPSMTMRMIDIGADRAAVLWESRVLDIESSEDFDDLARVAAHACGIPPEDASANDEFRQWFAAIAATSSADTSAPPPVDPAAMRKPFTAQQREALDRLIRLVAKQQKMLRQIGEYDRALSAKEGLVIERVASEQALRESCERLIESEERLRLALESGRLGSWHLDFATNQFQDVSPTCRKHYGLPPEADRSRENFYEAVDIADRERVRDAFLQAIAEHQDADVEYRVHWPDGSIHWINAHGRPFYSASGEVLNMMGVTQDVTARKQLEYEKEQALQAAEDRADRDPLTGLLNHPAFHARLEEESSRALRENSTLAVVMLDLDNFKFFNDVYGHATGDEVLRHVADKLQEACRLYDTIARFGGDEFALLMPNVAGAAVAEIEARLNDALGNISYQPAGQETSIPITLSLGVALFHSGSAERHEVVRLADARLLRSKTGGDVETEADRVRAAAEHLFSGFSMMNALVTAVDNKDRYTRRHSEDVMEYSLMIARNLGMDEEMLQTIQVAALLHDVGKIGVPDHILRKPSGLTDEEFEAIMRHPQMGALLVGAVPGFEAILDAVRHHHERWDGVGYPAGLRGKEIPLMARLMAVADAFSAMTTDRPYRKSMAIEDALRILKNGAGVQWDPMCIRAFLRSFARDTDLARAA